MTASPIYILRDCTLSYQERAKHQAVFEAKVRDSWDEFIRVTASANAEEKRAYALFLAAEAEWRRTLREYSSVSGSAHAERRRVELQAWDEFKRALEEPEGGR
jgi:hypothetical protein